MFELVTDQTVLTEPSYKVLESGTYNAYDFVICYRVEQPEQQVQFFAKFIATGEF
jgi:hypothetical protein